MSLLHDPRAEFAAILRCPLLRLAPRNKAQLTVYAQSYQACSSVTHRLQNMEVESREYKLMISVSHLAAVPTALEALLEDIRRAASLAGMFIRGKFDHDDPRERFISFIDTADHTLYSSGVLLRQRVRNKTSKAEYTLKCRSEDRFVAMVTNVAAAPGRNAALKFEEDIAAPYLCRYSKSATVATRQRRPGGAEYPRTLQAAAHLFPVLLTMQRDGRTCSPKTALAPVNRARVLERVYRGPSVELSAPASKRLGPLALIVWSRPKTGHILTAELSFRHEKLKSVLAVAPVAKRFYETLQRQDWVDRWCPGKTQFIYTQM